VIANYIYELVKLYNQFYQTVNINQEPDAEKKAMRLTLSRSVAKVIASAMNCLGIRVPERM
jgi:arginyl-tRNA synthetase